MEKPWLAHYEQAVPHSLTYPQITLQQTLADTAARFPDHTAITLVLRYLGPIRLGGQLTYRQLQAEVKRFAAALHALGVRKGDRVALMLPNLPQFVIAFYGALTLGAIVVNTNPTYTAPELRHQFDDAGAETVVLLSGFYSKIQEILAQTSIKRVILTDVSDYVPAPLDILVKRALRRDKLMVDVPAGEGIYHWRASCGRTPSRPQKSTYFPRILPCSNTRAARPACPRPPCLPTSTWWPTSSRGIAGSWAWPKAGSE